MSRSAESGRGNGVSRWIGRVSLSILAALVVLYFTAVQSPASGFRENAVLAFGGLSASDEDIYTDIVNKAGGSKGNICVVPVSSYPCYPRWLSQRIKWHLDILLLRNPGTA